MTAKSAPTQSQSSRFARFAGSDFVYQFCHSPLTIAAAAATAILFGLALLAPLIAPQNPFDLASLSILDGFTPPVWMADGNPAYLLGTDGQGRDILSAIFYGMAISIKVGFCSVFFAGLIGVTVGLISGYVGGRVDAFIMRLADIQLTFPAILIALMIDGLARGLFGTVDRDIFSFWILTVSLSLSFWVQYARTVRGSTLVEKEKDYIQAAKIIGLPARIIVLRHILPNISGPILVIATINLALAIVTEATLSFLGVGMPATQPSLGTLIATGNDYLYSGEWWIAIFPGLALALLVLAINFLGDWLRDVLNPKLR